MAVAMGGGPFHLSCPRVYHVRLAGKLREWVSTKDVVLHLLAVGSPAPDRLSVNYLDRDALPGFVEKLATPTKLHGKVKKSTFDVALDLNIRFALPSSYLCRASAAPLRIGFVKPYADRFYNFQIQTGQTNNLTLVYSQLLKCIEMF